MTQLGDVEPNPKGANSVGPLPNPLLNPLMNPILAQNLGRWAQVYMANPPEKREQALIELLRELGPRSPETNPPGSRVHLTDEMPVPREIFCPECQRQNQAGHAFCQFCGSQLHAADAPRGMEGHDDSLAAQSSHSSSPPVDAHSEWEVQWLRDKATPTAQSSEPPARTRWKYALPGLAILVAGIAFLTWRSVRVSSPKARPASKETFSQTRGATGDARTAVSPQAGAPADEGSQELLRAQQYLTGKGATRDSAQAATLLWKSVGKRNAAATLLLADLYMRGDGVPKSCEQARMLLTATARRGIAVADQKLLDLERNGCQ